MFPVAILAGGLATRLRPLTECTPKSLITVAGRPFLFYQLELLKAQGIHDVVLCVGFLGDQIRTSVGDGSRFGLVIRYSFDGDEPLGTGGAIGRAVSLLGEHFFVLNGDSYLRCSYERVQAGYRESACPALMTVLRNDNRWVRSNAVFRDGVVNAYDKQNQRSDMTYVDFGLSVMSAAAVARFSHARVFDLSLIFSTLAAERRLAGMEMTERFYEVGSMQGIRDTEAHLLNRPAPV